MIENKLSKFVIINTYYTSDCYMHQMRNNVRTIGLLRQSEKKDSKCTLFVAIVGYSPEINSSLKVLILFSREYSVLIRIVILSKLTCDKEFLRVWS